MKRLLILSVLLLLIVPVSVSLAQDSWNLNLSAEPQWSPDGEWIAFVGRVGSFNQIFRMRPDGRDIEQLTSYENGSHQHQWSPDGEWIAFVAYPEGHADIFVMRADGSNQLRLTDQSGYDEEPQWSPDGEWLAFVSDRDSEFTNIYRMRPDGSDLEQLTENFVYTYMPRWSPDGMRLAYLEMGQLYWLELDQDDPGPFPMTFSIIDGYTWWMPTPGQIAVISIHPPAGPTVPYRVVYDQAVGGDFLYEFDVQIRPREDGDLVWSPDGAWLAFTVRDEGQRVLVLMESDGSKVVRLGPGSHPTWSPDGAWLVFMVDESFGTAIYRSRPDGSRRECLTCNVQ